MKKQITILTIFFLLSIGLFTGQASASNVHSVKAGDTLWRISIDNNVSVKDLQKWNGLDSTLIFPTQEIKLEPEKDVYVVERGDTLSEIAESLNITLSDLIVKNAVISDLIYPEDELLIGAEKSRSKIIETEKEPPIAKKSARDAPPPIAKSPPAVKSPPVVNTAPSKTSGREMTMTATAYTAYCTGCSGTTYTGIDLRTNPNQKVIAVDPNIIPLGSRVWVEGYGEAIAGDIGGAIKGNIIDVFMEHRQDALNWGRKTVTIKILE